MNTIKLKNVKGINADDALYICPDKENIIKIISNIIIIIISGINL